jgi:hypothetical protein
MPLLDTLKGLFVKNATYRNPPDWFYTSMVGGNQSDSGEVVNERTAMSLAWVWQAVSTISNDIGRLPCVLYERRDEERVRANRHPGYKLAKKRPNPFMSSKTFRSVLTKNACLLVTVWLGYRETVEARRWKCTRSQQATSALR